MRYLDPAYTHERGTVFSDRHTRRHCHLSFNGLSEQHGDKGMGTTGEGRLRIPARPLPVTAWLSQVLVVQLAPCKCDCALPQPEVDGWWWACGLGPGNPATSFRTTTTTTCFGGSDGRKMMGDVVMVVYAQMPNYKSTGRDETPAVTWRV